MHPISELLLVWSTGLLCLVPPGPFISQPQTPSGAAAVLEKTLSWSERRLCIEEFSPSFAKGVNGVD